MKAAAFTYHVPQTVDEAVALLAAFADEGGRIIAGGQSLVPMMAFRLASPGHLIDINLIADLARLAVENGVLRIGSTVRHAVLENNAAAGVLGSLLRKVAGAIAHKPIRNRGTFCGSIVHADPSSEWCLVAATLDAEIVARSERGTRVLSAAEFFGGIMTTTLEADEIVVEARLPLLADDARFGFEEVSRRAGDFAMASALAVYRLEAGRIVEARLGVGGAEDHPRRIPEAEAVLAGAAPTVETFKRAADAAADAIDPMEDGQNTAAYRRKLVRAVMQRALGQTLS